MRRWPFLANLTRWMRALVAVYIYVRSHGVFALLRDSMISGTQKNTILCYFYMINCNPCNFTNIVFKLNFYRGGGGGKNAFWCGALCFGTWVPHQNKCNENACL